MNHRIVELDGLRGMAILCVLAFHLIGDHASDGSFVADLVVGFAQVGWFGVDLFFVLSGFLITTGLLQSKGREGYFRNFMGRRVLRIFPLYYLWVTIYLLVFPHYFPEIYDGSSARDSVLWLYLANFVGHSPGANHLWSLATEEQFYLAWPAVILCCPPSRLHRLIPVLLLVLILFRLVILAGVLPIHPIKVYTFPFCHCDGLLIGAWVAVLHWEGRFREVCPKRLRLVIAVLVVILASLFFLAGSPSFWSNRYIASVGYLVISCLFGALVVMGITESGKSSTLWLRSRVLALFGTLSYFLYLFHPAVAVLSREWLSGFAWFSAPSVLPVFSLLLEASIITAVTLGLALISWKLFESPILSLKRYFHS